MEVAITLLGGFAVTVGGTVVDPALWRRRHAASVVKVLAVEPGRRLHREQLMERLWPELAVADAAPRLHKAAHYARRALADPGSVVLADDMVTLFPSADPHIDAVAFEAVARQAVTRGDAQSAARAAELYTGSFLPEDPYETWTLDIRDRLHVLHLDVLRLAGQWQALASADPTDEEAQLHLVAALARRGDRGGALRQYERFERALRNELGVGPSRRATEIRARLEAGGPTTSAVPAAMHTAAAGGQRATAAAGVGDAAAPALVGRDRDRAGLQQALDAVVDGSGRAVFLCGEAGVGKTSLLAWLENAAAQRGMRVGTGTSAHVEGAWPYAPVLEALADLSRHHPTLLDGLDDALRQEIETGLTGRPGLRRASGGHQRLFVAAAELLRLAAAGSGAVLAVDDGHLADESSLRLLHYLARSTASEKVLLVVTHRPGGSPVLAEVRQSLVARSRAVAVDLGPLSRAEVATLVRQLAPDADEPTVESIWVASGGVPFFVAEMARSGGVGLPARQFLLSAVPPATVRSLASAAVLGHTFDTDEFVAVSGLSDAEAYAVLDDAEGRRLLHRGPTGYAFRHALVRDAVLDGLATAELKALHHRAARALIDLDASPARIGHHLVEGGDRAAAVPWMIRTAETAASLGAYREALDILGAIDVPGAGADRPAVLAMRADLLMACADATAVDAYREALAVTRDRAPRKRLRARLARAATYAGDVDTAAIALDGLEPDGSPDDVDLLLAKGTLALFQGDVASAADAATQARHQVALDAPGDWQRFDIVGLEGLVAHNRGEWFQRLRAELRIGADRPALASRIFDSHLCVAEYLLYGPTPYEEVLTLAAALRDTAQRSGVLRAVAFATALRGESALLMGDLGLAETELTEAVDLHRDIGSGTGEAHSLQRLAEVRLEQGNREEAQRLLARALPLARFSNLAKHLLQRIYGTMIAAAPDAVAAAAVIDRAEAAQGIDDYCRFCSIMFEAPAARARADAGDIDNARRHLHAAEQSAVMWEGTSWEASLLEVRAHLAAAEGDVPRAVALRDAAANLFEASGQPLDAGRCRRWQVAVPAVV
jgi:DNA-binding SARP family transcriptional activator/tetratricopeptide (TPR) repeat protein